MKTYRKNHAILYPLYSATIESLNELRDLKYPSKYFVLFLAADFQNIENKQIIEVAKTLIDHGLSYICTWGPGCDYAYGAFDRANVIWEEDPGKDFHVMSTSHEDETLDEALWFCIFNAAVDDKLWDECSTIAVAINEKSWAEKIETNLSDVAAFNDRVENG